MVKIESESLSLSDRKSNDKKRNCILICISYLRETGLLSTAQSFSDQLLAITSDFELADNVSLPVILSEFESIYEMKFGKKPIISKRKTAVNDAQQRIPTGYRRNYRVSHVAENDENIETSQQPVDLRVVGTSADFKIGPLYGSLSSTRDNDIRLPPTIAQNPELKELALSIVGTAFSELSQLTLDDVIGLEEAKSALHEAVILPQKYPQFFTGSLLQPWRGVLLFGPPGTGKTMLAKAVASSCSSKFFSVSPSTLLSKWRGESEKLVKCLFSLAEYNSPSVIYVDEIDAILPRESFGESGEHESTKRMRAEILVAMDGISSASNGICVIGSTNCPWNLSPALLRRFEKRILVDNPDLASRQEILRKLIPHTEGISRVAELTDGWSGDDLRVLCKEAAMTSVRRLVASIEKRRPAAFDATCSIPAVLIDDLMESITRVKPSCKDSPQYRKWYSEFGSS